MIFLKSFSIDVDKNARLVKPGSSKKDGFVGVSVLTMNRLIGEFFDIRDLCDR